jgi:hypothetical protein
MLVGAGVNATSHDATPVVPVAASVQLPEFPNDPDVGDELKLTDPDGVLAPLDAVSDGLGRTRNEPPFRQLVAFQR